MTSSKGVVLFAYNSTFNYVNIANISAALAKKFLGVPVSLITNQESVLFADTTIYDKIIEFDSEEYTNRYFRTTHDEDTKLVKWKNSTRANVYELSPYDQTLLIDCDYMVLSDALLGLFYSDVEFTCHREVYDVTGQNGFTADSRVSPYTIPMLWATVVYFRKSVFSKAIFDMMQTIRENYEYYAMVYNFKTVPYRNDYALSIAHHALSGYGHENLIPYKLQSLTSMTDVVDFRDDGQLLYQYKDKDRLYTGTVKDVDLHIMNKDVFTPEIAGAMLKYAASR